MSSLPTTPENVRRWNHAVYEEMLGRCRGSGRDPAKVTWEYHWTVGPGKIRPKDIIQAQARGRLPVPTPTEQDVHLELRILQEGRMCLSRRLVQLPEEVRRVALR